MRTWDLSDRRTIILAGMAAGTLAGVMAWAVFGTGAADRRRLEADQAQLASRTVMASAPLPVAAFVASAIGHPLFALTTGPGAQSEPVVVVTGLSRTPFRRAALMSVNGAPAAWLTAGQSSGPVSLVDVAPPKAVVDTPFGRREVWLGEGAARSAAAQPAQADAPPPGVRLPPAPASAPTSP